MNIEEKALRCKEIMENLFDECKNMDEIWKKIEEHTELVREIRRDFIFDGLPTIRDEDTRNYLKNIAKGINQGYEDEVDPRIREVLELTNGKLEVFEIEDVARDFFGQDASMYDCDCAQRLYDTSIILIDTNNIPPFLWKYFSDLRLCHTFKIHLGTIILCRTIIELCLNDLHYKKLTHQNKYKGAIIPRSESSMKLYDLINEVVPRSNYGVMNKTLHEIRNTGNKYVHIAGFESQKSPTDKRVKEILTSTISVVQELYTKYEDGSLFTH